MKTRILIIIIIAALQIAGKAQEDKADCVNITLDTVSFDIIPEQDTMVSGFLHYMDSTFTVYPVLRLLLSDTTDVTSPDIMVLSSLQHGSKQYFQFRIRVKKTNGQTKDVVQGLFHIYDSDMAGDSIVTCYFPITLNLRKSTGLASVSKADENRIYPNPAGTTATIEFDNVSGSPVDLFIYDLKGAAVRMYNDLEANYIRIDKQELANGMYFYKLTSADGYDLMRGKIIFQ